MKYWTKLEGLLKEVKPEAELRYNTNGFYLTAGDELTLVGGYGFSYNRFPVSVSRFNDHFVFSFGVSIIVDVDDDEKIKDLMRVLLTPIKKITDSELCTILTINGSYSVEVEDGLFTIKRDGVIVVVLPRITIDKLITRGRISDIFNLGSSTPIDIIEGDDFVTIAFMDIGLEKKKKQDYSLTIGGIEFIFKSDINYLGLLKGTGDKDVDLSKAQYGRFNIRAKQKPYFSGNIIAEFDFVDDMDGFEKMVDDIRECMNISNEIEKFMYFMNHILNIKVTFSEEGNMVIINSDDGAKVYYRPESRVWTKRNYSDILADGLLVCHSIRIRHKFKNKY